MSAAGGRRSTRQGWSTRRRARDRHGMGADDVARDAARRLGGAEEALADILTYDVIGKRLELLKLAAPRASLIAILQNLGVSDRVRKGIKDAARSAGVRVDIRGVQD